MEIEGKCLDDILRQTYEALLVSTDTFDASKGKGFDLLAPKIILRDPRARVSATVSRGHIISALGEFCWYMRGSANIDEMRYYLSQYPPEGKSGSIEEAYGPRLIGTGEFGRHYKQFERVIDKLKGKPDSRRAVIALLEPSDLEPSKSEAPCTSALQFIRRRERLHMIAMMRSNDAYLGFPHDIFCFTMMQELIARSLGVRVGEYHHFATSLHLYEGDRKRVEAYIAEGYQSPVFSMPKMPSGCQLKSLASFLEHEAQIRVGGIVKPEDINLPVYWKDLAVLLLHFAHKKKRRGAEASKDTANTLADKFYRPFLMARPRRVKRAEIAPFEQAELKLEDGQDGQS